MVNLDGGPTIRLRDDIERPVQNVSLFRLWKPPRACNVPMLDVGLHFLVVKLSPNKTLEAEDGVGGVYDTLSLGW